MNNALAIGVKGKGFANLFRRSLAIIRHYGLTPVKMDKALRRFAQLLGDFDCSATFPLTASTLTKSKGILQKYRDQGIEFAVHGYYHVDHSHLSLAQQLDHFTNAQRQFRAYGLSCTGFRCPYLRWNQDTLTALGRLGFDYDGSQALAWDVVDGFATERYRRALRFYRARPAGDYLSLPRQSDNVIQIPYCLPDDEALVDRLRVTDPAAMTNVWQMVLHHTYELGELFTLGLHPERFGFCEGPLRAILHQARSLSPSVWIARLDEIAQWWRARTETKVTIHDTADGLTHLTVAGPDGTSVLARGVDVDAPTAPWADGYRQVKATAFTVHAPLRPIIGVSSLAQPKLVRFLQQQGYIVEKSEEKHRYVYYLDQTEVQPQHERSLLADIEDAGRPLLRLGRWPSGARSALSVTGDIDALTVWDYGLRFVGR